MFQVCGEQNTVYLPRLVVPCLRLLFRVSVLSVGARRHVTSSYCSWGRRRGTDARRGEIATCWSIHKAGEYRPTISSTIESRRISVHRIHDGKARHLFWTCDVRLSTQRISCNWDLVIPQRTYITFSLNENTLTQFIDSKDILPVQCRKQLLSFPLLVEVTFIF